MLSLETFQKLLGLSGEIDTQTLTDLREQLYRIAALAIDHSLAEQAREDGAADERS